MDKRTIIVLVLTMAMLFVFQTYFMPKQAPEQPQTQTQPAPQGEAPKPAAKADAAPAATGTPPPSPAASQSTDKKATKAFAVSTPYLDVTLTDLGGGISSVKLKNYKATVKGTEEKEIIENVKPYLYNPSVHQNGAFDRTYFTCDKAGLTVKDSPASITMTGALENGTKLKKTYTFHPDSYSIDLSVEVEASKAQGVQADFAVIRQEWSSIFKGLVQRQGPYRSIRSRKRSADRNYWYTGFDDGFSHSYTSRRKTPNRPFMERRQEHTYTPRPASNKFAYRLYRPQEDGRIRESQRQRGKGRRFGSIS